MQFTRTVAFRLFLLIAGVATVVLAALTLIAIQVQRSHLMNNMLTNATRMSDVIARSTRYSMLHNRKEDVQHIISSIGGEPGIDGIRIYNKQGVVVFATAQGDIHTQADMSAEACISCHPSDRLGETLPVKDPLSRIFANQEGDRVLGLITPIRNETQCSDAACHAHPPSKTILGVLDVKLSLAADDRRLAESISELIALSLGAILLVSLVSGGFIWKVVHKPFRELLSGMQKVADGRLDHRIEIRSHDEPGELAKQFNLMSTDLEKARNEITEWSSTLEKKVKEKSQALEMAHQQLLQAEKMASLGNLAASVAHELNNPLEGILTFARLLIKQIRKTGLPPEKMESFTSDLGLVADEARRCGTIVSNLLLFSRHESLSFKEIQLKEIVDRCVALTGHHARVHGVSIDVDCPADLRLECSPHELEQVLIALSVNAIEAMSGPGKLEPGGRLIITAARDPSGNRLIMTVRDTGRGMTEEIKAHIFEPFFTTKTNGKGVGLGLAIVYGIIQRHHGTIEVGSAPGEGTTFTVTIPLIQPGSQELKSRRLEGVEP